MLQLMRSLAVQALLAFTFNMVPPVGASPNLQKDYNELPAMGKSFWDGLPSIDFIEDFYNPLIMALGAISENGSTLRATALTNDVAGIGPGANPNFAAANAQQRQQSQNRNYRLFSCIMNYIFKESWIYLYLLRVFINDGVAAFNYIRNYGRLGLSAVQVRRKENEWDELTIRSLKVRIDVTTLFKWSDIVLNAGQKLGKTPIQMKQKFLEGLPDELQHMRSIQLQNVANAGYATAAIYPAFFPNALAGNANPLAGQPDLHLLCRLLNAEWITMLDTR
jgi:hypothetical protein